MSIPLTQRSSGVAMGSPDTPSASERCQQKSSTIQRETCGTQKHVVSLIPNNYIISIDRALIRFNFLMMIFQNSHRPCDGLGLEDEFPLLSASFGLVNLFMTGGNWSSRNVSAKGGDVFRDVSVNQNVEGFNADQCEDLTRWWFSLVISFLIYCRVLRPSHCKLCCRGYPTIPATSWKDQMDHV